MISTCLGKCLPLCHISDDSDDI